MMGDPPSFASMVRSWSDWACRITEMVLCVIGASMALLISVQVFSRYALNHSIFWSEEIGRICLVWISFLGASAVYKKHGHVGIDFFVVRLPLRWRRISQLLVVLVSFFFFVLLVYHGFAFAWFVSSQKTAALGLPVFLPYLVIPVSGLLFLLHGSSHLLDLMTSCGE